MMRMDAIVVNLPYSRYSTRVLPGLPVPSLLHTSEWGLRHWGREPRGAWGGDA